jgi:Saccharopine dehydrogenase NADP binding domain
VVKRVLIIGGYGNFGSYIARSLAAEPGIQLFIAGRSLGEAGRFVSQLRAAAEPEPVALDISADITATLAAARPDIVIHTTGPFQTQTYTVAEACLRQGCHYIDLADARGFVAGIERFDQEARQKGLLIVSGASSVPCLTAALIDYYRPRFASLHRVDYGISAAQQTNRGLATLSAILSYVGKPFTTLIDGRRTRVYGWQGLHAVRYPRLGRRLFGNCDVPDLELFPARYPGLRTLRFAAGTEIRLLHIGLWLLSWLVRARALSALEASAPKLLRLAFLFDALGSGRSGFHMFLSGAGPDGKPKSERFFMIAGSGHGPYIPCMPAILLAKGLASGQVSASGARACLDLIDLETYLGALQGLDIEIIRTAGAGR